MQLDLSTGRIDVANWVPSPNCDQRDGGCEPEVIIVHCISLPPGEYGGGSDVNSGISYIRRFFQNKLSADEHPYFESMAHLQVSAHFLITRDGQIDQFVSTHKRAWHAGESVCLEKPKVNNFSIGIELEGLDTDEKGFTSEQYQSLARITQCLISAYPKIKKHNVFAHSDIAPGRKPDPGPYFDWPTYLSLLT